MIPFAAAPAAFGILALTALVSGLGLLAMPGIIERNLLRPYRVVHHREYLPILTSGFIHGSVAHLLLNSLTLYFFGPALERRIGTPKFLALYLLGLILSDLGTVMKYRNNPERASLGASGAINAVLFAYIVYYPMDDICLYFVICMPATFFVVGYLAYSWWASKQARGRINHDAHLDGAFTGLIFVGLTDFDAWSRAFRIITSAFG
jgi:membrane associated rhomboid family serine protease